MDTLYPAEQPTAVQEFAKAAGSKMLMLGPTVKSRRYALHALDLFGKQSTWKGGG